MQAGCLRYKTHEYWGSQKKRPRYVQSWAGYSVLLRHTNDDKMTALFHEQATSEVAGRRVVWTRSMTGVA